MSRFRRAIPVLAALVTAIGLTRAVSGEVVRAVRPKSAERSLTSFEQLLTRHGITPDSKGVAAYLQKLRPSETQRQHARELVVRLGSGIFAEREAATRELASLPRPPVDALTRAAAGNDPEVRWRTRKLLETRSSKQTPLLFAIFQTISDRQLPGLASDVIETIPLCDTPYLIRGAQRAIIASARSADAAALRSAIRHENVHIQTAAVTALAAVLKQAAHDDLRELLGPPKRDDRVVLAAARGLANLGDRQALRPLISLLSSDVVAVRSQSAIVLRSSTGQNFGFASYAKPESRTAVAGKWDAWMKQNGATAELRFPLRIAEAYQSYLNGNTLLACGYKNKVIEYTPEWKAIWEYDAKGAFSAEKLPNGNVLISCYGPNEVIEVTPEKKVVWRMKFKSCLNARQLPNGNILIAGHTSKQVLEVNRDKKTVWSFTGRWNCYDAHRLANGNTMISSELGVHEISPEGKTVWDEWHCRL